MTEFEQQQLKSALRMIGDEAGRPETEMARSPHRWRRRGIVGGVLVAAAAVCAAVLTLGVGTGESVAPPSHEAAGDRGPTAAQQVACSRVIAVGNVVAIRDARQQGRANLTFAVQDWIKPSNGPRRVTSTSSIRGQLMGQGNGSQERTCC